MELIPVIKDGQYLEVHPTTLKAHKAIGFVECDRQEPVAESEPVKRGRKKAEQ